MPKLEGKLYDLMKTEIDKYTLIQKLIVHLNKFKIIHKDGLSLQFLKEVKSKIYNIIIKSLENKLNLFFLKYELDFCKYYALNSKKLNNLISILEQNIEKDYEKFENDILLEKNKILSFDIQLKDKEIIFLKNYINNIFQPNKQLSIGSAKIKFLEDSINFSVILKKYILIQQYKNKNNFIIKDEYLNDIKYYAKTVNSAEDGNFILSLMAKMIEENNTNVFITKIKDSQFQNLELVSLQAFLCLGNQEKYELHFDFGEEENEKILSNEKDAQIFIKDLKKELSQLLKINEDRLIITNVHHGSLAIDFLVYDETKKERILIQERLNNLRIKKLKKIKKKKIFDLLLLNTDILDPRFNRNSKWGIDEKRGGENYLPPFDDWNGFGLNVLNKYDFGNNIWLDYHNKNGEYSIAYLGISNLKNEIEKIITFDNDSKNTENLINDPSYIDNQGQNYKVGNRICVFQDPKIAEENAGYLEINGCLIVIMFMIRINPNEKENYRDAWILDSTPNNIRPYRILIKKLKIAPIPVANPIITWTFLNYNFLNEIISSDEKIFENMRMSEEFKGYSTINNQKEVVDKYIFAIRLYSSAYFRFINTYLREQGTIINEITTKRGKKLSLNETQIKSWAKCLQYALTSYKIIDKNIEDNTIVYRGIKKNKFPKNMGIGSSFFCSEFISTSLKEEFSLNWIEGEGTLLKITIRNNGTNGYSKYCQFIDSISVSNKPPQNEVLIASNCFYRITNIIRQKKIDYVALICEGLLI